MPSIKESIKSIRKKATETIEHYPELTNGNILRGISLAGNPHYQGKELTNQFIFDFRLHEQAQKQNKSQNQGQENNLFFLLGDTLQIYNIAVEEGIAISEIDNHKDHLNALAIQRFNFWWESNKKHIIHAIKKCYNNKINIQRLNEILTTTDVQQTAFQSTAEQQIESLNQLLSESGIQARFFTWENWLNYVANNVDTKVLEQIDTIHKNLYESDDDYQKAYIATAKDFVKRQQKIKNQLAGNNNSEASNSDIKFDSPSYHASLLYLRAEAHVLLAYAQHINCSGILYAGAITTALAVTNQKMGLAISWVDTADIKTAQHTDTFENERSIFISNIIRLSQAIDLNKPQNLAVFFKLLSLLLHISLKDRYAETSALKINDLSQQLYDTANCLAKNIQKTTLPRSEIPQQTNHLVKQLRSPNDKKIQPSISNDKIEIGQQFKLLMEQINTHPDAISSPLKSSVSGDIDCLKGGDKSKKTSALTRETFFSPRLGGLLKFPNSKNIHQSSSNDTIGQQTISHPPEINLTAHYNKYFELLMSLIKTLNTDKQQKAKISDERAKFKEKIQNFYNYIANEKIAIAVVVIALKEALNNIIILNCPVKKAELNQLAQEILQLLPTKNGKLEKSEVLDKSGAIQKLINNSFKKFIAGNNEEKEYFLQNLGNEIIFEAYIDTEQKTSSLQALLGTIVSERDKKRGLQQQIDSAFKSFILEEDKQKKQEIINDLYHKLTNKNVNLLPSADTPKGALKTTIENTFNKFVIEKIPDKKQALLEIVRNKFQNIIKAAPDQAHQDKLKKYIEKLAYELVSPYYQIALTIEALSKYFNKAIDTHQDLFAKILSTVLFSGIANAKTANKTSSKDIEVFFHNFIHLLSPAKPKTSNTSISVELIPQAKTLIIPQETEISTLLEQAAALNFKDANVIVNTFKLKEIKTNLCKQLDKYIANSGESLIQVQELAFVIQQAFSVIYPNDHTNKAKCLDKLLNQLGLLLNAEAPLMTDTNSAILTGDETNIRQAESPPESPLYSSLRHTFLAPPPASVINTTKVEAGDQKFISPAEPTKNIVSQSRP
jgi:hypothetical protein